MADFKYGASVSVGVHAISISLIKQRLILSMVLVLEFMQVGFLVQCNFGCR